MSVKEETVQSLAGIPDLTLIQGAPLSRYTRFGIGGPASVYAETPSESSFIEALRIAGSAGSPYVVIGGGTNLIVSDAGFPGIVLRLTASKLDIQGACVHADAGASLQDLVDLTTASGLKGLETLTGIPGSVGAAVYGNAGAYGHSIMERVRWARFFDGDRVRRFTNAECEFRYRESVFKRRKEWIVFSVELHLDAAPAMELQSAADGILKIRNEKYPPTMKCAGSIFKNLIWNELPAALQRQIPPNVVREGKVPSAWFLEQAGSKGMTNGGMRVADYHANLIYNAGGGTAGELIGLIQSLKARVRERYAFELEEEVQYVGFGEGEMVL